MEMISRLILRCDTPFEIASRIGTDSVNIRFYINGRPIVIFSLEVQQIELQIHDPRGGVLPKPFNDT